MLWIHIRMTGLFPAGFPHSDTCGSSVVCTLPQLFAAYRVLHRLQSPRHPPYALVHLPFIFVVFSFQGSGALLRLKEDFSLFLFCCLLLFACFLSFLLLLHFSFFCFFFTSSFKCFFFTSSFKGAPSIANKSYRKPFKWRRRDSNS